MRLKNLKKLISYSILTYLEVFLRVNLMRIFFFLVMGVLISYSASAQDDTGRRRGSRVIDDTSKQVYGPRTSRYFYEQDVFFNREKLHQIDTFIRNFHKWNYTQRFNNLYQDLGTVGTAIQPIYYQAPETIGARSGTPVYDLYWDTEPVRYFDTKSPYTNMKVIIGGKGRSLTRATFSRNINPRWNFGFTYRGMYVDKQVPRSGKGVRITRANYYDAYTTYQTKDSSYRIFANYRRMFHRVDEYGGVKLVDPSNFKMSEFSDLNAQPWLTAAESNDYRRNTHIYHQYKVGKALQVYHTADWLRQKNKYLDYVQKEPKDFYDFKNIATDTVNDVTTFTTSRNEVGLKGNVSKIFYNGYVAIRKFAAGYNHFQPDTLVHPTYDSLHHSTTGTEQYLGGRIALQLDSIGEVLGWMEVLKDGRYRIQGDINSRWFEGHLKQMRYAPGAMEQAYRGTFDYWNNNFGFINLSQLNGYLHYNSSFLKFSPGFTFTRLNNLTFYKKISSAASTQQVLPMQSSGNQVIATPEVKLAMTFFKHITLSGQFLYTKLLKNDDDAIQVPKMLFNGQLSYENIFYNGNLDMHAGVDVHWKSDYYANGYDPAIRQFYVQQSFLIPSYSVVDLFFDARIKRGRIFFKYHNFTQAFTKSGYLATPFYPGQSNVLDFGFDWSFYD
jgi:hypothetical protein